MKIGFTWIWLIALSLPVGATEEAVERSFHVAPSPRGTAEGNGTAEAPFATLEQARRAVRAYVAERSLRASVNVVIHGGLYRFEAPVRFDGADSGRDGHKIIYRAAPGEKPVLSGGRAIVEWREEGAGQFAAQLPPGTDFRQLWVNGARAVRARSPNEGAYFTTLGERTDVGFELPRGQIPEAGFKANEVEMSVLIAWMHKRLRVAALTGTNDPRTVGAVIAEPEWDGVTRQPQGDRVYRNRHYWLEGAPEYLDAAGEFHLDRNAGHVVYLPRNGEPVAALRAERPELETLIELAGTPSAPVSDLVFEGLTFVHTGWTRPNRHGFVDVQANSLVPVDRAGAVDAQFRHDQRKDRVPAAFQATTADRIELRGCLFTQLGGTAVLFMRGGDDNMIEGNAIYDVAAGGIEIGDDAVRPATARFFPRRTRIANNVLAHVGTDYFGSVPILGYYTDGSVIEHNEIVNVPYTGISQGWGWGKPSAPTESRGNRIFGNRVINYMRRLDDGGGIYTTDRQLGSEIVGNVVREMLTPDRETKAGGALYLDQCTEGYVVRGNVVSDALRWLFIWNPNIRGNRVLGNFADTEAWRNDGADNEVDPAMRLIDVNWSAEAAKISAASGLEERFRGVWSLLPAGNTITVASSSLDFEPMVGTWLATDRWRGARGAICQEATDAQAWAQWRPIVPRQGRYRILVWLPEGVSLPRFELVIGDLGSPLPLPGRASDARWHVVGEVALPAGASAAIRMRSADGRPVVADTLRLEWLGP